MSSASQEDSIKCTSVGYLPWHSPDGLCILVKCYYSPQATGTIISPSDIIQTHVSAYTSWTQHANIHTRDDYITFQGTGNTQDVSSPLYEENGLWYYSNEDYADRTTNSYSKMGATIRQMTKRGLYELVHARMGHPGESVMTTLHKHIDGVSKLSKPHLF